MSLHIEFLPLFENAALLRKILTWGRESSQQVQDLASKVDGGEQQRSCSPETSLQLQRYEMARFHEEGPLTGLEFGRSNSSNSLQ